MKKPQTDFPIYLFHEGTNSEAYKLFRPSYIVKDKRKQWRFRLWAPHAKSVSIIGAFNAWNREKNPMEQISEGIWECTVPGIKTFDLYKYSIETKDGKFVDKADPYATHAETAPGTASKVYDVGGYKWNDDAYMKTLRSKNHVKSPMSVYEVHLGSWKKHGDAPLSYVELADELVSYVKEMGYTHVELMPVTEYPFDGSWGYQTTGLYAPTSRYGTPKDFMYLVDKFHEAGIGVILDFVVSHFPKDAYGLYQFDGEPLYEYADPLKAEHKSWGTMVYDYSKGEVKSFLISAVSFFFEYYHIDGIRMDAVASMLYLDYDRKNGEWRPNKDGGNYNLEAIEFLQDLNKAVFHKYPYALMIAEESTAFPMVTMPPSVGGLGFNFKWNMGWMNDVLDYIKINPFFKKGAHDKLTFSITYAFSENYVLPFSHDEVVHGKASMIGKMPGNYLDKFQTLKSLYLYQYAHPGKKLNFMGNEFGQFIEWDYKKELDWILLDYDSHRTLKAFVKDLNDIYRNTPALYRRDDNFEGFRWVVVDDKEQNVVAFNRYDEDGNAVLAVVNFSDVTRVGYEIGVEEEGEYEVLINSNDMKYGGYSALSRVQTAQEKPNHGFKYTLNLTLESSSALLIAKLK